MQKNGSLEALIVLEREERFFPLENDPKGGPLDYFFFALEKLYNFARFAYLSPLLLWLGLFNYMNYAYLHTQTYRAPISYCVIHIDIELRPGLDLECGTSNLACCFLLPSFVKFANILVRISTHTTSTKTQLSWGWGEEML